MISCDCPSITAEIPSKEFAVGAVLTMDALVLKETAANASKDALKIDLFIVLISLFQVYGFFYLCGGVHAALRRFAAAPIAARPDAISQAAAGMGSCVGGPPASEYWKSPLAAKLTVALP